MTRLLFACLFAVSLTCAADAQTVSLVVDRWAFPEIGNDVPVNAELDGNTSTREWVQTRLNDKGAFELRGMAARDGLCRGEYFDPYAAAAPAALPGEMFLLGFLPNTPGAGGIQRYVVFGIRGYYEIAIGFGCEGAIPVPPLPAPPAPPGQ